MIRTLLVCLAAAVLWVGCGDNTVPPAAQPVAIELDPAALALAVGTHGELAAVERFDDGTTRAVTADVTWRSSDDAIATVTGGDVAAIAPGTATITAALDGLTGTATITVSAAALVEIQVAPATPELAAGTTVQLTATGVYADG